MRDEEWAKLEKHLPEPKKLADALANRALEGHKHWKVAIDTKGQDIEVVLPTTVKHAVQAMGEARTLDLICDSLIKKARDKARKKPKKEIQ